MKSALHGRGTFSLAWLLSSAWHQSYMITAVGRVHYASVSAALSVH